MKIKERLKKEAQAKRAKAKLDEAFIQLQREEAERGLTIYFLEIGPLTSHRTRPTVLVLDYARKIPAVGDLLVCEHSETPCIGVVRKSRGNKREVEWDADFTPAVLFAPVKIRLAKDNE